MEPFRFSSRTHCSLRAFRLTVFCTHPPAAPSHHFLQFREAGRYFHLELVKLRDYLFCRRVFDGRVLYFSVFVDGEVVVVRGYLFFRHEEAALGARACRLFVEAAEALYYVGDVVFVRGRAFVVERVTVCLHVVEPDVVGAARARFGEYEDGGRYARIGLEYA